MTTTVYAARRDTLWQQVRRVLRAVAVLLHIFYGLLLALVSLAFWRPYRPLVRRLALHWQRLLLRILGVHLEVVGSPASGTVFLVSNHVSWLDIPVIGAQRDVHFLSKAEVREWPLIGALAQAAGTLFIKRGNGESRSKAQELAGHLQAGRTLLVFPEGTTGTGHAVKRFFSPLFAAPLNAQVPVQPLAVRYLDESGQVDAAVAFVGDDEFTAHLWQLLRRDRVRVQVHWLPALAVEGASSDTLCGDARLRIASVIDQ